MLYVGLFESRDGGSAFVCMQHGNLTKDLLDHRMMQDILNVVDYITYNILSS